MNQTTYPSMSGAQRSGRLAYYPPVGLARFGVLLILAGAALAISALLVAPHLFKQGAAIVDNPAMCGQDFQIDTYGCEGVFASRYAVLWGQPLALWGMAYFLGIVVWLLAAGRALAFNALFLLVCLAGAIGSVAMLVILLVVLPGMCRWCLAVNGLNFLLTIMVISCYVSSHRSPPRPGPAARTIIMSGVLAVCSGSAVMLTTEALMLTSRAGLYKQQYFKLWLNTDYQRWLFVKQKRLAIPFGTSDQVLGPRKAKLRITVFKDFQCPACHRAWQQLKQLQEQYPRHIALVAKHYPLDKTCNDRVLRSRHPFSCAAARASQAAYLVGGEQAFWKYYQLLEMEENYKQLDMAPYMKLAGDAGLDLAEFEQALADPRVEQVIAADVKLAGKLKITGTPAIFFNGKHVRGWNAKNLLDLLARKELTRKGVKLPRKSKPEQGTELPAK